MKLLSRLASNCDPPNANLLSRITGMNHCIQPPQKNSWSNSRITSHINIHIKGWFQFLMSRLSEG
jgi:hypothetical protein